MSKPAFLVDGQLEKRFIQDVCPGSPVRLINCNGDKVSSYAISKRIATHYRLLNKKYSPIIVVVDRETRDISAEEFKGELIRLLIEDNVSENIVLGIADRMIENWILADKENISRYANISVNDIENAEGKGGKYLIKKIIPEYHETTVGVELLKKSNPSRMHSSKSFLDFFNQLQQKINCWWLNKN
jgi:hypothetical protein